MWNFLCDALLTAALLDAASISYYACQWYGNPVAAAKGIWANGPEVKPLLTMGALAPLQALRLRRDLQDNFEKIRQHVQSQTNEQQAKDSIGAATTMSMKGFKVSDEPPKRVFVSSPVDSSSGSSSDIATDSDSEDSVVTVAENN